LWIVDNFVFIIFLCTAIRLRDEGDDIDICGAKRKREKFYGGGKKFIT